MLFKYLVDIPIEIVILPVKENGFINDHRMTAGGRKERVLVRGPDGAVRLRGRTFQLSFQPLHE